MNCGVAGCGCGCGSVCFWGRVGPTGEQKTSRLNLFLNSLLGQFLPRGAGGKGVHENKHIYEKKEEKGKQHNSENT